MFAAFWRIKVEFITLSCSSDSSQVKEERIVQKERFEFRVKLMRGQGK